jgi:hypothetical protein
MKHYKVIVKVSPVSKHHGMNAYGSKFYTPAVDGGELQLHALSPPLEKEPM